MKSEIFGIIVGMSITCSPFAAAERHLTEEVATAGTRNATIIKIGRAHV